MIPELESNPPPPSPLSGRDCLTLAEFTPEEVELILDEALKIKGLQRSRIPYRPLRGRTLAMVFQKPSNRTRVSFEVGMYQLGGHALHLLPQEIQIGKRETPSDTGRVLARYIDAIMVRTFDHEELEELAGAAEVPVINGVYVAGEDAACVRGGLPLTYLYLLGQQVERVAAELVHADLEGDARAVRGLLEDHRQRPAA